MPSTPVAQAAADFAAAACEPYLLAHSYRTYCFGRLLVSEEMDVEVAFVASMLHDIGLTDEHRADTSFDEVGAEVAARFLEARGWGVERIRLVEQAIVRHTNYRADDAPEYRLVQLGAGLDVVGMKRELLAPAQIQAVLAVHPRDGFAEQIGAAVAAEVRAQPDGTFARPEEAFGLSTLFVEDLVGARGA